jgi:hypothetical protein
MFRFYNNKINRKWTLFDKQTNILTLSIQ